MSELKIPYRYLPLPLSGNGGKILAVADDGLSVVAKTLGSTNYAFNSGTGGTSLAASTDTAIGSVTITPTSTSSVIMIMASARITKDTGTTVRTATGRVKRGTTTISKETYGLSQNIASSKYSMAALIVADAPNTTSAVTYNLHATSVAGTQTSADWELLVFEATPKGDKGDKGDAGSITPQAFSAVASSATITLNAATSCNFETTALATDTTLSFSNTSDGEHMLWVVTASGGARNITVPTGSFPINFTWTSGNKIAIASGTTVFIWIVRKGSVYYFSTSETIGTAAT